MSTAPKKKMTLNVKRRAAGPQDSTTTTIEGFAANAETLRGEQMVHNIELEHLHPGPYQPRHTFQPESLETLAASLRSQGVVQPLVVRKRSGAADGYEIVAGERRWRAAKLAGLAAVPCIIREMDDAQAALIALIENTQREDLTAVEKAQGYQSLLKDFGLQQKDISRIFGQSKTVVSQTLSLLKLPTEVQSLIRERLLDGSVAMELLALKGKDAAERQRALAEKAVQRKWGLQQLRRAVKAVQTVPGKTGLPEQPISGLSEALGQHLETAVRIKHNATRKNGLLEIRYRSLEELQAILARMGCPKQEFR
ncbi:MAG: ParB/RepB/Spo0J family partition protein [Gammaproteobacteria bacterium]